MQLTYHGLNVPRTEELRHRAEERFKRTLGPILHRVARLNVWVDDVNGPRGGVDKRCRVRAQLSSGASLVVRASGRSAECAVDRAARRLRLILTNRLKRQWTARRRSCRRWRHRSSVAAEYNARARTATFRGPTRHELLAMAYVDGELSGSARRRFRVLMHREPALMRQVAGFTALRTLLHQALPTRCTPDSSRTERPTSPGRPGAER